MATNAAFLAAIQGMTVTGVKKHYNHPPPSLVEADLPAAFPLMPSASLGEWAMSCIASNKSRGIGYVICVAPLTKPTQPINYGQLAGLMDALETKLDALTVMEFIDYEITTTTEFAVAGINYWSIVATVSGRDM